MTTYKRFEDLPVWQKAAHIAARMFSWTTHPQFRGKGDLANQLQRATLSFSNNIAEGFERGSTKELLQFLYIAREDYDRKKRRKAFLDEQTEFRKEFEKRLNRQAKERHRNE